MTSYVSCACNRVPHAADWGDNGLVCYAARNAIAIYDPNASKVGKVVQTLHRHKGRVNIVRWIKRRNENSVLSETECLSGSIDGTAIIWSKIKDSFECTSILDVGDVVTIIDAQYLEGTTKLLICTGSTNGQLKLWVRDNNEVRCFQTLVFGRQLPIEGRLSFLPNSKLILLAVAIEDSSIQLYSQKSQQTEELIKVQSLVGHEDWVRCLDFSYNSNGHIFLASGSQDSMIRLWKISPEQEDSINELRQKRQSFTVDQCNYIVSLETVLSGHEGWVYGVHWHPSIEKDGKLLQPLKLLTCSLDKSMIIWSPDPATGIWFENMRVGEVGGNSLGFYGCKFGYGGSWILAHGYLGSFHIWKYADSTHYWTPAPAPSGHFAEVVDICWDPKGRFLISVSADQTTRIHAPWKVDEVENWHEIGRPQIHGYDMSCVAILKPDMFASGAEEKVVRIFTASAAFGSQLKKIANAEDFQLTVAESAEVPALGLTNKATFDTKSTVAHNQNDGGECETYTPQTEEELVQNSLWPELQKLYGHGYEIFSMAARHDGSLLATASKATSPEHAAIILWDIESWSSGQKLMSHQLTVTQMAFSPNDEYLLSVSRDRRWSLFRQVENEYNLIVASSKKDSLHSRIIWCCAWAPDSHYFATGSRDGKVGIWSTDVDPKNILPVTHFDANNNSVTALAFAPSYKVDESYILAMGYESGCIEIQKVTKTMDGWVWKKTTSYDTCQGHHLTVKRLMFRPLNGCPENTLCLASCGADHTVKIHSIDTSEF